MLPYSNAHFYILLAVAQDFCSLPFTVKTWIGLEYSILRADEVNLNEKDLEIKVWKGILNQNKFEELTFTIEKYLKVTEK